MKKKRHTFRNILIVLIIIAVVYLLLRQFGHIPSPAQRAAQTQSVETATVSRGTISLTTEGNGSIEAAQKNTVTGDYDLKIDQVSVEDGDLVSEGDQIATIDTDSVQNQIETKESELSDLNDRISNMDKGGSESLTAPVSGRIKRIWVKSGDVLTDTVKQRGGLMEINPTGRLKVEFTSSERVKVGDEVTVSFSSYDVDGTVTKVNDHRVTVEFTDNENYQVDTQADVKSSDGDLLGSGQIRTAHPYLVDGSYGIANEIYVNVNDWVDAGNTLLSRTDATYNASYKELVDDRAETMEDLRALRELKDDPEILAQGSGIVSDLMLTEGGMASAGAAMYTLISTDTYSLKAQIDELDIAQVEAGQDVSIVFDAFDDETFEGKVEKVSALGQNSGGVTTYTVTISVPGSDKLKTAMSATATIELETKENVLLVPVDAIYTEDGQQYVIVQSGDTRQRVQITTGIMNNTYAEVTDGLSEGAQVVLKEENSTLEDLFNRFGGGAGRGTDGNSGSNNGSSTGSVNNANTSAALGTGNDENTSARLAGDQSADTLARRGSDHDMDALSMSGGQEAQKAVEVC